MGEQSREPTVEEILASIKKVIAQDGRSAALQKRRGGAGASDRAPASVASDESEEDEILELSESDTLPDGDAAGEFSADASEPMVAVDKQQAIRESLAALATLSEPRAAPQIVRSGETSLEGLVREMLRPILVEWLNEHLPDLVEQLVAKEISRISGKR